MIHLRIISSISKVEIHLTGMAESKIDQRILGFAQKVYTEREQKYGDSHALPHIRRVITLSLKIASSYKVDQTFVYLIALLHDIYDKKYDTDPTDKTITGLAEKLKQELITLLKQCNLDSELIINIIDRISYSMEVKEMLSSKDVHSDWKKLLGENGYLIRNICSDADKIDALSSTGLYRCIQYTKELKPDISKEDLKQHVLAHSKEKLLRLKDHFIRTNTGKELAKEPHEEFVKALEKFMREGE